MAAAPLAPPELLPEVVDNGEDRNLPVIPISEGSYPVVHHNDPKAPLQGLLKAWQRWTWQDPPGTVTFIQVWGYVLGDNIRHTRLTAEQLCTAIHTITGKSGFYIVPPECNPAAQPGRDAPYLWAVHNISPTGGQQVIDRGMWSFPDITFFAQACFLVFPRWLMALEGFIDDDEVAITRTVRTVLECPEHPHMIGEMLATNPRYAGANCDDAIWAILDSLWMEVLMLNNGNIIANAYMDSPTSDIYRWRAWVAHLRSIEYSDYTNATATPRDVRRCLGCRSTAYPTHLCPFPTLPG